MNAQKYIPPRPDRRDPRVVATAAKNLAPKIIGWWGKDAMELHELEKVLVEELAEQSVMPDGYELARSLEKHLEPDAELVSILDDADALIYEAMIDLQVEWVKAHGLTGPAIGSMVRRVLDPKAGAGRVTANYASGQSSVYFPHMGHTDPDDKAARRRKARVTTGFVEAWERLIPEPTEPCSTATPAA